MKKLPTLFGAIAFCSVALAQTTYGDWRVDSIDAEGSVYAATMNTSGGFLGKSCTPNGCIWLITLQARCKAGDQYAALVSASSGTTHVFLQCSPNDKTPGRYIFTDFNLMDSIISSSSGMFGIAFAMEGGDFRVSRFSLLGYSQAVNDLASQMSTKQRRGGEHRL